MCIYRVLFKDYKDGRTWLGKSFKNDGTERVDQRWSLHGPQWFHLILKIVQAVRNDWVVQCSSMDPKSKEFSNKNKSKNNKNSLCLVQGLMNLTLGQAKLKKHLSKVHPYYNCWIRPESLHSITLPRKFVLQWGLLTFKLLVTSWSSCQSLMARGHFNPIGNGWKFLWGQFLELQFANVIHWLSSFVLKFLRLVRL